MENKLSALLTVFGKNHGTQNYLVSMFENWKNKIDKGRFAVALFMNLSKASDTLNHNLLMPSQGLTDFEMRHLIKNCLTNKRSNKPKL